MIKIGVTGGIGSGKSTICKVFSEMYNIPIYNADDKAKYLIENNIEIKKSLTQKFGPKLYSEGKLNRQYLAGIIFNDVSALNFVNSIVHPVVGNDYIEWTKKFNKKYYTIKEAALLFESGTYKGLDLIITISCPEEIRIKRVMERNNTTYNNVVERIRNQWHDDEKIKRSNFVIVNDDKNSIVEQVQNIHSEIIKKYKNG